eukprot:XP_001708860.1 Hypothetical protein GL50803_34721 [Giardia lamblia ATCC 50803]
MVRNDNVNSAVLNEVKRVALISLGDNVLTIYIVLWGAGLC